MTTGEQAFIGGGIALLVLGGLYVAYKANMTPVSSGAGSQFDASVGAVDQGSAERTAWAGALGAIATTVGGIATSAIKANAEARAAADRSQPTAVSGDGPKVAIKATTPNFLNTGMPKPPVR
jgi:hypothetical protein